MTLLQKLKKTHSDKFNQLIFLDKDARVLNSCNTIFDTSVIENKTAKTWYPFIESIFNDVWELQDQIRFAKVETSLPELPGTYDFSFTRTMLDGKEALLWLIYDYTELYKDLKEYQQTRNELEIRRDQIEKKYQNLIHFNEVLIEKNKELENINRLHQDYFKLVQNALLSPMNSLDSVNTLFAQKKDSNIDYVSELKNSFKGIQSIVEDLDVLTTSFQHPTEHDEMKDFNIYSLLVDVFDTFKKNTSSRKQLIFHIDDATPEKLNGKPVLLQQIIYCLMTNSYKLDPDNALEINVSPLSSDSEHDIEIQYTIKERQPSSSFKIAPEKVNELKLRLELVKKLIEMQNGTISIETDQEENICINCIMKYRLPVLT